VDDARIGAAFRAVRIRKRLTQVDVAEKARISPATVSRLERGHFGSCRLDAVRRVAACLEMWLAIEARYRGTDLNRILNSAHAALHEALATFLNGLAGWQTVAEVSFSVWGERGVIDILAWHEPTRSLLIIELKTLLVDPQDLVQEMGRRLRLAHAIAREQGWDPLTVSAWVVLTDTRTNRRHVQRHTTLLKGAFPSDGRALRSWLAKPSGTIRALSFWTDPDALIVRRARPRQAASVGQDPRHLPGQNRRSG
jgi:transcriptional regulator with XRE-family HTH domain